MRATCAAEEARKYSTLTRGNEVSTGFNKLLYILKRTKIGAIAINAKLGLCSHM